MSRGLVRVVMLAATMVIASLVGVGAGQSRAFAMFPDVREPRNSCMVWAEGLLAQGYDEYDIDWIMHVYGCRKPYATWIPASGMCPRVAYALTAAGLPFQTVIDGTTAMGCFLFEDGFWGRR